jgi:hypothetical protein
MKTKTKILWPMRPSTAAMEQRLTIVKAFTTFRFTKNNQGKA